MRADGDTRRHRPCLPPAAAAAPDREDHLARLRRIEGQVRGVQRMIETDRPCPEVVTQLAAVSRAAQEVAIGLLLEHVRSCVLASARDPDMTPDAAVAGLASSIRQVARL
jgi:DNA-binding FrmR family transcriptional regulator